MFLGVAYLSALGGVRPQLSPDNLKCVILPCSSGRPGSPPGTVRLVGPDPAPSKCVLLCTSKEVRKDLRSWVLSDSTVKFDVRNLGGHIDTYFRCWATTLTSGASAASKGVKAVAVLPAGFSAKLGIVRSKVLTAAFHGREASEVAQRAVWASAVKSRKTPLAHSGTVLSLLDGPVGCDPCFFYCLE